MSRGRGDWFTATHGFVHFFSMILFIQIPCFNEAETLARVLADLPAALPGFDSVEVLVVDDGSSDETLSVARDHGVKHIVRHSCNRGLAAAFSSGLRYAITHGADVVVNTDGDHQYPGQSIEALVRPILSGAADVVIGDRRPVFDPRLKWTKRQLHRSGQWVIAKLAGRLLPDPVSGFRAMNRDAAASLHLVTSYSYTIESLFQLIHKGFAIQFIPIETNEALRPSRLFRNLPHFVLRSAVTLLRVFFMFQPLSVLLMISTVCSTIGVLPIVRFLVAYFAGDGDGHLQSLVLGVALVLLGGITLIAGLIADLIAHNRRLLEFALDRSHEPLTDRESIEDSLARKMS